MAKETVGMCVVGAGLVGRRHVEAIARAPGAALASVVDPAPEAEAFARARGAPWFASIDAMLAHGAPDGVILATPTALHAEQAAICVAAGLPTLIEKPIGSDAAAARRVVEAAEARGVPLATGHHRRHNPLVRRAKEALDGGAIGDVTIVQAQCWFFKPEGYFDEAPWRKRAGAGPISVNLAHDIDLLRHFCGEVAIVQATARASARGHDNEDAAAAILTFRSGAIGTISVADAVPSPWSWELTARENPVYAPTLESCYAIGGSKGSLSLPDLRLWSHPEGGDWWSPIAAMSLTRGADDPLAAQIGDFIAVIRGEATPVVSGRDGLRTLRVIEAIKRAAATGARVAVEDDAPGAPERPTQND